MDEAHGQIIHIATFARRRGNDLIRREARSGEVALISRALDMRRHPSFPRGSFIDPRTDDRGPHAA